MTGTNGSGEEWLDLADAIALLRRQIVESQERIADPTGSGDEGVLFRMGEITVELGMELTGTRGVNGGLRWSVVSLGGKKESSRKATHTVTVKLAPHRPDGSDVDVADEE